MLGRLWQARGWSLATKIGALVLSACLLPLAIQGTISLKREREVVTADMQRLLSARAEQIAREFDGIHNGYLASTLRLARLPVTTTYCEGDRRGQAERLNGVFRTFSASDQSIRAVSIIDRDGRIVLSSRTEAVGADVSSRRSVRAALAGQATISNVWIANAPIGEGRSVVSYLVPVNDGAGHVLCVATLAVDTDVLFRVLTSYNDLVGAESTPMILDNYGIRIAHTRLPDLVFRPAAPLPAEARDAMVAEKRFGERTAALLADIRPSPEHARRAVAVQTDADMFESVDPVLRRKAYSVGQKLRVVPWTVYYMTPASNLDQQLAVATGEAIAVAVAAMAVALVAAAVFAAHLLRPVRSLVSGTRALAAGDADVRVVERGTDELAELAHSFNNMAGQIRQQGAELKRSNEDLEHRVRERSGLLQAIVDNAIAVILVTDAEGRVLLANARFAEEFGGDPATFSGRPYGELVDADTAAVCERMDAKILRGARAVVREITHATDDGDRTLLVYKCPILGPEHQVERIVSIATDITDRKQAEAHITGQLHRMQLLDEITRAVAVRAEVQSVHEAVLRALEDRLGAAFCCILEAGPEPRQVTVLQVGPRSELLAGKVQLAAGTVLDADTGMLRCLAGDLVYEPHLPDGTTFGPRLCQAGLGSVALAPLGMDIGAAGALLVAHAAADALSSADCEFLRQLSSHVSLARRQAALVEELRGAYDELHQSQQVMMQQERLGALGRMASGIAHDINNAISPAALYAEALLEREPGLSEHARRQLGVISRAVDDVAATVARLREFYRPATAATTPVAVDLNRIIPQVVDLTHARWSDMPQERGVTIELRQELAPGLPPVNGVESELREALINLVFNAVDAMPQGGTLTLSTQLDPADGCVVLSVADTGVGMGEAVRARCLEPFFTTKGERGSGLGLAMVYGVAQRHAAALDIQSTPGCGTTASLRFAACIEPNPTPEPVHAMPPPMRILLVDDDPALLRSLLDTLTEDGHAVTAAEGGQSGIDLWKAGGALAYDVVITDLGMPYVDGHRVAAAVKAASPSTPVVLLTGWGQRLAGQEGADAAPNIDWVLSKPPKLRELRAALAAAAAAIAGDFHA